MKYRTPVVICSNDGKIIYKNHAASLLLKRTHRNAQIDGYMDELNQSKLERLQSGESPGIDIIRIQNEEFYRHALAYLNREDNNIMLIFLSHLQFYMFGSSAAVIQNTILRCADEIVKLIDISIEDKSTKSERFTVLSNNLTLIINEITAKSWGQPSINLRSILTVFRSHTIKFALEAGYSFSMPSIEIPESEFYEMNPLNLLTELSTIIVTMFEISSNKKLEAAVEIDNLNLTFKFNTDLANPPYYIISADNIMRLTNHYNCDVMTIVIFDCLLKSLKHEFLYSISNKKNDRLSAKFTVPLPAKKSLGSILHSSKTGFSSGFGNPDNSNEKYSDITDDADGIMETMLAALCLPETNN